MDRYLPNVRVVTAHTGAEFESGAVHRARGVNEPMPGVEPEPAGVQRTTGGLAGMTTFGRSMADRSGCDRHRRARRWTTRAAGEQGRCP